MAGECVDVANIEGLSVLLYMGRKWGTCMYDVAYHSIAITDVASIAHSLYGMCQPDAWMTLVSADPCVLSSHCDCCKRC